MDFQTHIGDGEVKMMTCIRGKLSKPLGQELSRIYPFSRKFLPWKKLNRKSATVFLWENFPHLKPRIC